MRTEGWLDANMRSASVTTPEVRSINKTSEQLRAIVIVVYVSRQEFLQHNMYELRSSYKTNLNEQNHSSDPNECYFIGIL